MRFRGDSEASDPKVTPWVQRAHHGPARTDPARYSPCGRNAVHTQATFLTLWANRTSSTVAYACRSRHSIVALPRAAEHRDTRTRPPEFRERTYRSTVRSGSRKQHSTSLKTMTSKRSSGE